MAADRETVHRKARDLLAHSDTWVLSARTWTEVLPRTRALVHSLTADDWEQALADVHFLEDTVPNWRVSHSALNEEPRQPAPPEFQELRRVLITSIGEDESQETGDDDR